MPIFTQQTSNREKSMFSPLHAHHASSWGNGKCQVEVRAAGTKNCWGGDRGGTLSAPDISIPLTQRVTRNAPGPQLQPPAKSPWVCWPLPVILPCLLPIWLIRITAIVQHPIGMLPPPGSLLDGFNPEPSELLRNIVHSLGCPVHPWGRYCHLASPTRY